MGKGTCSSPRKMELEEAIKKKNISGQEHEPPTHRADLSMEGQNASLIEYQEQIETDPRNVSITKGILTKLMARNMVNIRTDNGEGLGSCVYINVNNPNSKYPYAVSADCYNIFIDFFAQIIEEIHGETYTEAMLIPQFGDLSLNSNMDLNGLNRKRSRAMYTEICVRRNLQNIPFAPIMKQPDRKKVISKMEDKIRNLFKESVETVVPETWDEEMDSVKNDLDDCWAMRDYPDDRVTLAFRKNNIVEGCVLNFDDHIRYIVSSNDGRIGELFSKMYVILSDESLAEVDYCAHPVFGHLTLSPAHVGTGMTIRLEGKFPFVSRLADIDSLISDYDCVVEKKDPYDKMGMLLVTNKRTFNTTEERIYRNIILAFNKLSHLEDELELTTAMAVQDDYMSAENLIHLFKIITETQSVSYTKKYLTESLISQYSGVKSNFGSSFNNCIRHNAYFARSLYPRACDSNCYLKFSRFFDPILMESNCVKLFNHSKHPKYGSTAVDKRYQLHHPTIISYRVRFNRNFDKFPFPMMMSGKDRADIERMVVHCFDELPVELEGDYCSINSIQESVHYEDIICQRLIPTPCEVDLSAGFYRDWPNQRGIFISKKNDYYPNIILLVLVNVIDHIKVVAMDPTGRHLNLCYDRAVRMMKHLDLKLENKYAKKSGYGFLTSVPCYVGCGMRISALLRLKNLGDKREVLESECIALQFVYRGSKGHGTIAEKNVFDISLKINMNVTEQYILMIFVQKLKDLINLERTYDSRIPVISKEVETGSCEDSDDAVDRIEELQELPPDAIYLKGGINKNKEVHIK